jgi:hypothetical protein
MRSCVLSLSALGLLAVLIATNLAGAALPDAATVPAVASPAATAPVPAASQPVATHPAASTRPAIAIGYDTTRITKPLRSDGTPDYLSAVNEEYSKGVTLENNAGLVLFDIFDANRDLGPAWTPEALRRLAYRPKTDTPYFEVPPYESPLAKEVEEVLGKTWSRKDHPAIDEWLKRNEPPLRILLDAGKRERFHLPLVNLGGDGNGAVMLSALDPALSPLRAAGRAIVIRANLAIGEGRYQEAWQDIQAVYRLGGLAGQGATLIERFVAVYLLGLADQATARLAGADGLPPKLAREIAGDLQKLPPAPTFASVIDRDERYILLDTVLHPHWETDAGGESSLGRMFSKLVFDSNEVVVIPGGTIDDPRVIEELLRRGNRYFDATVKAMSLPTYPERVKALAALEAEADEAKQDARNLALAQSPYPSARTQWFVSMWMSMFAPKVGRAHVFTARADTGRQLALLAVALSAHKAEKGKYPDTLDALAPECLKTIPTDFFSGKPFIYKPAGKGYMLYSVGENMKDDGGKDRDHGGDDLVVEVKAES